MIAPSTGNGINKRIIAGLVSCEQVTVGTPKLRAGHKKGVGESQLSAALSLSGRDVGFGGQACCAGGRTQIGRAIVGARSSVALRGSSGRAIQTYRTNT